MKTATAYIRVSTEGQATDGVSLETQQAKIAAWCLANDVELGDVFVDAGVSGKLRAVELIRSLKAEGYSLRAIAAELDSQKIPTKDRKGTWQHTTVKSILARV